MTVFLKILKTFCYASHSLNPSVNLIHLMKLQVDDFFLHFFRKDA